MIIESYCVRCDDYREWTDDNTRDGSLILECGHTIFGGDVEENQE